MDVPMLLCSGNTIASTFPDTRNLTPETKFSEQNRCKKFFDLCFIGSVGFDDHLTD